MVPDAGLPQGEKRAAASLETELIDRTLWRSHAEARVDVLDWIEVFYDRVRRHSALEYLAPAEYEERYRGRSATA